VRKVVYHGNARVISAIFYHARAAPSVFKQLKMTSQHIAGGMYLFQDRSQDQVTLMSLSISFGISIRVMKPLMSGLILSTLCILYLYRLGTFIFSFVFPEVI
jgi:hypothetical protein